MRARTRTREAQSEGCPPYSEKATPIHLFRHEFS